MGLIATIEEIIKFLQKLGKGMKIVPAHCTLDNVHVTPTSGSLTADLKGTLTATCKFTSDGKSMDIKGVRPHDQRDTVDIDGAAQKEPDFALRGNLHLPPTVRVDLRWLDDKGVHHDLMLHYEV